MKFFQSCVEEIDRYRRLDEWLPSYRNVVTISGLGAKKLLMRHGRLPTSPIDFLPFTQVGTYSDLRIAAFDNLLDLGFIDNDQLTRWFLFNLSRDPSPYCRLHFARLLGRTVSDIAIGTATSSIQLADSSDHVLEIQAEGTTEARQAENARKRDVRFALDALRVEMGSREELKPALWEAVCSRTLTLQEMGFLLDVCAYMYEEKNEMLMVLPYPRYWQFQPAAPTTTADGKLSLMAMFTQTGSVRTRPVIRHKGPKLQLNAPAPQPIKSRESLPNTPSVVRQNTKPTNKPVPVFNTAPTHPPTPESQSSDGPPRVTLKLKINSLKREAPKAAEEPPRKIVMLKLSQPKPPPL